MTKKLEDKTSRSEMTADQDHQAGQEEPSSSQLSEEQPNTSSSESKEDTSAQEQELEEEPPEEPPLRQLAPEHIQPNPTYPSTLPRNPDLPASNRPPYQPPVPGEAPPGFEDPYDINRLPGRGNFQEGLGRNPASIGHNDLYPPGLGPNDPMVPYFGGQGGIADPRFRGQVGQPGSGGMYPTFDDPLFGGPGGQSQGNDPLAPAGARYDPSGPGDPRMSGGPGGRRGPPGGGFGGGII